MDVYAFHVFAQLTKHGEWVTTALTKLALTRVVFMHSLIEYCICVGTSEYKLEQK